MELVHAAEDITSGEVIAPMQQSVLPYRVQFATGTIRPKLLPEFPYMSTKLDFEHIVYTAIVRGTSLNDVVGQIAEAWPDAICRLAEQGVSGFQEDDKHVGCVMYGSYIECTQPSTWKRLSDWFLRRKR
jgi:hypothetical protein